MRLGNSDLNLGKDSAHEEIRNVKRLMIHPDYRSGRIYYDVGLAVAERRIEYTDFIRPLCLPFKPIDDEDAWSDDLVILAGVYAQKSQDKYLSTEIFFSTCFRLGTRQQWKCHKKVGAGQLASKFSRILPRAF